MTSHRKPRVPVEFNVGDRVKVVGSRSSSMFRLGAEYVVSETHSHYCRLVGKIGLWDKDRFALVEIAVLLRHHRRADRPAPSPSGSSPPSATAATLQPRMKPQVQIIKDHLLRVGNISGMEAAGMYKCRHLPARIHELRAAGMGITAVWRKDNAGQKYVRYVLSDRLAANRASA